MGNLYEELWAEIFSRLSTEKDLVTCMKVSKSWHRISSDVWVRRFWAQSAPLGLYFRTIQTPLSPDMRSPTDKEPSYLPRMNYISLYNYHVMEDNLESTRTAVSTFFNDSTGAFRRSKRKWQIYRYYEWDDDEDDLDEYLDCCNGLLLLLKSGTYQFYVCNPITTQQVPVPKACVHQNHEHFCAALAFDPSESPHHYRVVRIDYSESVSSNSNSALLDIFWSEYGQWVRHRLQLDPGFTEGFEKVKLCRQFVYMRGKLYSIAMSWKLLCIDLKTVEASTLELPLHDADKTGAMGCLGVSMDLLCYIKRMHDTFDDLHDLVVWYYDDRCESGEWSLRYSVSCCLLGCAIKYQGFKYDDTVEPYAISSSSDVLFFGTSNLICCYHLKSEKIKFVCHADCCTIDTPGNFWILRAFFVPFFQFRKRNSGSTLLPMVSDDIEILTAETVFEEKKDDEYVEVINVNLCDRHEEPLPPLIYPSEITEMHVEFSHPETSSSDEE
ncbi:hypothetical protein ABKV19_007226 [Rosa sericea]